MKINNFAKPFFILMLVLGLAVGCASTEEQAVSDQAAAEQAIADAKAANAQAAKMGVEWRDTGKMIEEAEAAYAAGDYTKALELANAAKKQAENAMAQAKSEADRLAQNGTLAASEDSSASTGSAGAADQYEVARGDNLWSISGKGDVYADPYQWPLIYKANRDKIKDADLIYPGQVFDIDRAASASDVDAAVRHARTRGAWSVGAVEASDEAYLAQ